MWKLSRLLDEKIPTFKFDFDTQQFKQALLNVVNSLDATKAWDTIKINTEIFGPVCIL